MDRAESLSSLRHQRAQPQSLGPIIGNIKVSAVAAVTRAVSHSFPVAGLVAGARVSLWIGKTFGQQRTVAEALAPLLWQHPQSRTHGLGGQVGRLTFCLEHNK